MSFPKDDNELDRALTEAFSPPAADFDAWQRQHSESLACLDPQRVAISIKRKISMKRAALLAAAAVVLVCVWLGIWHFTPDGHDSMAFAQIFEELQKAKTITWKTTFYERITSKDGKRTWIKPETRQWEYKSPGLYRETSLDEKGQIKWVEITDATQKQQKRLSLLPAKKEATLRELAVDMQNPLGPFEWVKKEIKDANLQWVETRKTPNGTVNVFRHSMRDVPNGRDWSYDFWIDPKAKRLVALRVPGSDIFDPEKEPDRNNPPEKECSLRTCPCHTEHDIVLDAKLDDSLFSLDPPEGYTLQVKRRPQVTEKEMIDYLGILADFNDKTFPDQVFPCVFPSDRRNKTWDKPKKDRTAAEQKLLDTDDHYRRAELYSMPTGHFVSEHTVEESFRYLGKGVKLGDKDRIVCWYRLKDAKDAKTYRVVYGDLSVKDVAPEDLPLPVQENRGTSAFAKTFEQIQKAKTMTWKRVFYEHISTRDEKRIWAHTGVTESSYKAPGLHRDVRLDDNGKVQEVEITDTVRGRRLSYSPQEKKATISEFTPYSDDSGPYASTLEKLNSPNLQWVGKRTTAAGEANVFRHTFRWYVGRECDYSYDFWIDAKTKRLVALYSPGTDVYNYEHDPAFKATPGEASGRRAMGGSEVDIRYDVPLDDSLFRTEPPEGYAVEVKKRDRVTEKEMIDYFGIVADFNDKTFPDEAIPVPWNLLDKIDRANGKPQNEQTPRERKLLDTDMRYGRRFGGSTSMPILIFFSHDPDSIVEDSFRYLGKGVKLGDKNRIVCWYKLKGAKDPTTYRVLYGDLSVKDVAPKDLPLPVGP